MSISRLNARRIRIADSPRAASFFFAIVLLGLVAARTWLNSSTVAFVGVFAYSAAAPLTWPLADAAFARYSKVPLVNAPARSRIHWVWSVLAGVLASILIGALGS